MLVYSYVRTEPQSVIGHTRAKKVVIHHCVLAANFCLCFLVGLWSLFLSLLFLFWRNANLAGGSSWLGVCVMVLMSGRFTCDQLCPCDDVFTQFFSPADRASERCRPYRRKKKLLQKRSANVETPSLLFAKFWRVQRCYFFSSTFGAHSRYINVAIACFFFVLTKMRSKNEVRSPKTAVKLQFLLSNPCRLKNDVRSPKTEVKLRFPNCPAKCKSLYVKDSVCKSLCV